MEPDAMESKEAEPVSGDGAALSERTWVDAVLGLSIAALMCAFLLQGVMAALWAIPVLFAFFLLAQALLKPAVNHLVLFGLFWMMVPGLFSFGREWPICFLGPLVAYGAWILVFPSLRRSAIWFRLGRLKGRDFPAVIAVSVVSAIALVVWILAADPDLGDLKGMIPDLSIWLLPLVGLGFALLNAAMEEAVFRGILMDALDRTVGRNLLSNVVQAAVFGAAHYHAGFPRGAWGFAMVFVYGIMLGAIRRRCNGLLAPWVAHVAADLVIFVIMVVVAS